MANPFSGLENIGQSYLQGVQLANQRQARQEAIAQRQEEARIRQDYYNQLGQDRQAALEERRRARMDQFASVFGKNLKLTPEGDVDIPASAFARPHLATSPPLIFDPTRMFGSYGTTRQQAKSSSKSP